MNVDNVENGKNDGKTSETDQHAQRRKQHLYSMINFIHHKVIEKKNNE